MTDFKTTLNILKTSFEMKANLNKKEPTIQQQWLDKNIYQKLMNKNKDKTPWILHDGPPYANGDIHVGHALNKILKDIIVRYRFLNGYNSHYIPGWDTHGLPIEHALLKKGGNKEANLTVSQRRDNCRDFAIKNVDHQLEQFKRLGLITDFKDKYLTLEPQFEYDQLSLFKNMVEKGLVYQDYKPVFWSWSSHSALAEAEIEYKDVDSYSIFVSFDVIGDSPFLKAGDKLLIWTTTPWTLPSNQAIAVHPDFKYARVQVGDKVYVLLAKKIEQLAKILNWDNYTVLNQFTGRDIENVQYKHIWIDKVSPIILADYVTDTDGTGLVHNASGFGLDDYYACKKYGISVYCPIDDNGKFNQQVNDSELEGVFYDAANELIIKRVESLGNLLKVEKVTHSAAVDWRTKKPVIYRATKQWFVNISKIQNQLLAAIDNVVFPNEINRKQLVSMITNRKEWCISRQRVWGVPIPIIFDEDKNPIMDVELIQHTIDLIKQNGTNSWFEKPVEFFLTEKYKNSGKQFIKEKDIMDVWFDSGSSYNVLSERGLQLPADLYLEGVDQYRGWFNSSLICSVIQNKSAPYKRLISHGFTLDEQGRKMSKSIGNVIDPLNVCNEYGADILRMWVASSNYQEDVRISKNILTQISEMYRRIRNTIFKFILSNLSDFDYENDKCLDFDLADAYVLNEIKNDIQKVVDAYEKYDFVAVLRIINLEAIKLSGWYFDIIKDSLYCDEPNNKNRRSIQTVLFVILNFCMSALAPIIPHTCEEAYQHANFKNKKESIFLTDFVKEINIKIPEINKEWWKEFFMIKDAVFVQLEKIRKENIINKNTQAKVVIKLKDNHNKFTVQQLQKFLNVAQCEIIVDNNVKNIQAECSNANLVRCERCWNYYPADQINEEHICSRCKKVLESKK